MIRYIDTQEVPDEDNPCLCQCNYRETAGIDFFNGSYDWVIGYSGVVAVWKPKVIRNESHQRNQ